MLTFSHLGSRIPDPGVKKAPNPGSGSATLVLDPQWFQCGSVSKPSCGSGFNFPAGKILFLKSKKASMKDVQATRKDFNPHFCPPGIPNHIPNAIRIQLTKISADPYYRTVVRTHLDDVYYLDGLCWSQSQGGWSTTCLR
jgi:hypothetical protein